MLQKLLLSHYPAQVHPITLSRIILLKQDKPLFKWRHFEPALILLCVRWYCRYQLSYQGLEDMMFERGLSNEGPTIEDFHSRSQLIRMLPILMLSLPHKMRKYYRAIVN